jgi:fructose-1,6-bisphosphatase/inositol monophosphatase family enzyme
VRKALCLGAAAAGMAYVAAGFLGGLVYEGIKLLDFAAGKIILE